MSGIGSRTECRVGRTFCAAGGLLMAMAAPRASAQDTTVAQPMEPVVVTAAATGPSWLRGFYHRRQVTGGRFLTREDLQPYDHTSTSNMLSSRIPSVQLSGSQPGRTRLRLRGQRCAPMVWLDGASTPAAEFDLDVIPVSTVAAIEVYASGSNAPAEFRTPFGRDACGGVIVVWSRMWPEPGDDPEEGLVLQGHGPVVPVYRADEVDEPAHVDSAQLVKPAYPDSLHAFGIEGSVLATFVVDTTGAPVQGTIEVLSATSPAFATAVRIAIAGSRFTPARKGGRLVRQALVVPYRFTVKRRQESDRHDSRRTPERYQGPPEGA